MDKVIDAFADIAKCLTTQNTCTMHKIINAFADIADIAKHYAQQHINTDDNILSIKVIGLILILITVLTGILIFNTDDNVLSIKVIKLKLILITVLTGILIFNTDDNVLSIKVIGLILILTTILTGILTNLLKTKSKLIINDDNNKKYIPLTQNFKLIPTKCEFSVTSIASHVCFSPVSTVYHFDEFNYLIADVLNKDTNSPDSIINVQLKINVPITQLLSVKDNKDLVTDIIKQLKCLNESNNNNNINNYENNITINILNEQPVLGIQTQKLMPSVSVSSEQPVVGMQTQKPISYVSGSNTTPRASRVHNQARPRR